jgi:hypothetical protein
VSGLTFSLLFCLLRENVAMESAGREALPTALGTAAFSGEYVSARVAEGVLLCEDDDVLPVPSDVLVRSEADRDRRSCEPKSVTEEAMLCLEACLRFCGVVGTLAGNWYWSGTGGGVFSSLLDAAGGIVSAAGMYVFAFETVRDRAEGDCLCPLLFPPKKEGRREKMPCEDVAEWSAMLRRPALLPKCGATSDQGLFHLQDPGVRPAGETVSMLSEYVCSRDDAHSARASVIGKAHGGTRGRLLWRALGGNVFRFAATADTLTTYPDAGTSRSGETPACSLRSEEHVAIASSSLEVHMRSRR